MPGPRRDSGGNEDKRSPRCSVVLACSVFIPKLKVRASPKLRGSSAEIDAETGGCSGRALAVSLAALEICMYLSWIHATPASSLLIPVTSSSCPSNHSSAEISSSRTPVSNDHTSP